MTSARPAVPVPNMPANWSPPNPSFTSRFPDTSDGIVAVYLGAQGATRAHAFDGLAPIRVFLATGQRSYRIDYAVHKTAFGLWEAVAIAYFNSALALHDWAESSGFSSWWSDEARLHEVTGYWQECLVLPHERVEALHSAAVPDGHSHGGEIVGPIRTHAYWGGMRDRLPIAGQDWLDSPLGTVLTPRAAIASAGRRITVSAPENLAIIRSGQDLTDADAAERAMYDEIVRETLREGMRFLAEEGVPAGCCACRYMIETDETGTEGQRSFGHCLFLSLTHLEEWAKSHPTHLAIFGSFFKLLKLRDNNMNIRFWHEVAVIPASGQLFEYLNCHPATGLIGFFDNKTMQISDARHLESQK